jgi:ketosteroid isomerase-like protein
VSTTSEQRASESSIRALIESWAAAVRARDLDGVLADHSNDIQMFDVPPPNEVRGIDAYRETWPPFFEWLEAGSRVRARLARRHSRRGSPSRPPCFVAGPRRRWGRIPTTASA